MNKTVEILVRDCNGKKINLIFTSRTQFLNWVDNEMLEDDEILLVAKAGECLFSELQVRAEADIDEIAEVFENDDSEGVGAPIETEPEEETTIHVQGCDGEYHQLSFSTWNKVLKWAETDMDENDVILSVALGDMCIYDGEDDDVALSCEDVTGFFG
jgi:hypothetical protein